MHEDAETKEANCQETQAERRFLRLDPSHRP